MPPDVVKQGIAELKHELLETARSVAADGVRWARRPDWWPSRPSFLPTVRPGGRSCARQTGTGRRWWSAAAGHAVRLPGPCWDRRPPACATMPIVRCWVVPGTEAELDGPALIAYDGSPAAREAIAAVGRLLPGRPALVVHAWESPHRHTITGAR